MKIVVNRCYGGFNLSLKALSRYAELKGRKAFFYADDRKSSREWISRQNRRLTDAQVAQHRSHFVYPFYTDLGEICTNEQINNAEWIRTDDRADPVLVQVVTELGDAANGDYAELEIVEIPDGIDWTIEEYDGMEHVAEAHRTW